MRKPLMLSLVAVTLVLASPRLFADDLGKADYLLCTAAQATLCNSDGDCEIGPPWNWNIPQFIEVDLTQKLLRTTKASGNNRTTPIRTLLREDGLIFLQGVEAGRAFSFVIEEETGFASIAIARDGVTVGVFGACTPAAASRKP